MDYDFNCYDSIKHNRISKKSNLTTAVNENKFKLLGLKTYYIYYL